MSSSGHSGRAVRETAGAPLVRGPGEPAQRESLNSMVLDGNTALAEQAGGRTKNVREERQLYLLRYWAEVCGPQLTSAGKRNPIGPFLHTKETLHN